MVDPRHRVVVCVGQSFLADSSIPQVLQSRLAHVVEVYRRLSLEDGGACIYVSGADVAGDGALQPEGLAMAHHLQSQYGIDKSDIDSDVEALNTIENAVNSIAPIRKRGAAEVVLVTSDFHAPRATFIFKTVFAAMSVSDVVLTVDTAPSRLAICPPRPKEQRPFEMNEWSMLERLDHETKFMEDGMATWLQREGFIVRQEDCSEALAALARLTAATTAALVAIRTSPAAPEVGTASSGTTAAGPPPLVCSKCSRRFGNSTLLNIHFQRCEPQEKARPVARPTLEEQVAVLQLFAEVAGAQRQWLLVQTTHGRVLVAEIVFDRKLKWRLAGTDWPRHGNAVSAVDCGDGGPTLQSLQRWLAAAEPSQYVTFGFLGLAFVRGVSLVPLDNSAAEGPPCPLSRAFGSHWFLVPDAATQQRLVDCGCHPRARRERREFGGLHFSINVDGPVDRNRFEIRNPEDWRKAVHRVREAASVICQSEVHSFISQADAICADVQLRGPITDEKTPIRVIYFATGGKSVNPFKGRINLLPHMSTYGTHSREVLGAPDGQREFGMLGLQQAEQAVTELRSPLTRWTFVLTVESDERLASREGLTEVEEFHWGIELTG